jgi:hypothetical protein
MCDACIQTSPRESKSKVLEDSKDQNELANS